MRARAGAGGGLRGSEQGSSWRWVLLRACFRVGHSVSRSLSNSNRFLLEGAPTGAARGVARIYKEGGKALRGGCLVAPLFPRCYGG